MRKVEFFRPLLRVIFALSSAMVQSEDSASQKDIIVQPQNLPSLHEGSARVPNFLQMISESTSSSLQGRMVQDRAKLNEIPPVEEVQGKIVAGPFTSEEAVRVAGRAVIKRVFPGFKFSDERAKEVANDADIFLENDLMAADSLTQPDSPTEDENFESPSELRRSLGIRTLLVPRYVERPRPPQMADLPQRLPQVVDSPGGLGARRARFRRQTSSSAKMRAGEDTKGEPLRTERLRRMAGMVEAYGKRGSEGSKVRAEKFREYKARPDYVAGSVVDDRKD